MRDPWVMVVVTAVLIIGAMTVAAGSRDVHC
jgi:hypothetical protein